MAEKKHVSLRLDAELLKKYHYVVDYDHRSINAQLTLYIEKSVEKFEAKHGKIEFDEIV